MLFKENTAVNLCVMKILTIRSSQKTKLPYAAIGHAQCASSKVADGRVAEDHEG